MRSVNRSCGHHFKSLTFGCFHQTDKSPEDAAVRETWEELGVPPKHIHILNCMDAWQEHSLMRFRVLPVVVRFDLFTFT